MSRAKTHRELAEDARDFLRLQNSQEVAKATFAAVPRAVGRVAMDINGHISFTNTIFLSDIELIAVADKVKEDAAK